LAVGDALATFPIAHVVLCALGFFEGSVGHLALADALLVGGVPHAEVGELEAVLPDRTAEVAVEAALVVVEEGALLVFGLGSAGSVFNEDLAVHAA